MINQLLKQIYDFENVFKDGNDLFVYKDDNLLRLNDFNVRSFNNFIYRSDLDLKEDEYLLSDLIGYAVYDNNKLLGKVSGINFNNNVLLKIDDIYNLEWNKKINIDFNAINLEVLYENIVKTIIGKKDDIRNFEIIIDEKGNQRSVVRNENLYFSEFFIKRKTR